MLGEKSKYMYNACFGTWNIKLLVIQLVWHILKQYTSELLFTSVMVEVALFISTLVNN